MKLRSNNLKQRFSKLKLRDKKLESEFIAIC